MDKTEPLILEEIVSRAVNAAPTWDNVEIIIKDVLRWADQKPENRRVYDIDDQESELRITAGVTGSLKRERYANGED